MNNLVGELLEDVNMYQNMWYNNNLYLNYMLYKHPEDAEEMNTLFSGMPGFICNGGVEHE